MAGLVPAISLRLALCLRNRDHRDSALRAGPVMTTERFFPSSRHYFVTSVKSAGEISTPKRSHQMITLG